ncbi:hypothetical protein [Aeromonas sp.]|jgi:hypothetical protein|uniref:hypothetical protein n=1 Tax=Aeromonas sp. TaxID=647 RepID=UPI002583C062|nr:hypothetical protein [Aeromonas sp.]MCX7128037.1 hypothetical protein [Aeromonas sp.]
MLIERKISQNDIKLFIGADTPATVTVKDRNGELVDLTTLKAIFGQARSKSNATDAVELPIVVLDQKTNRGQFVITFPRAFTEQFRSDAALKQLQYDIWIETFLNQRVPFQSGNIILVPVITERK